LNALFAHKNVVAKEGFAGILSHPDHQFYKPAQWYSALENLQQGNMHKAMSTLKKLANGSSEFALKSADLLEELN